MIRRTTGLAGTFALICFAHTLAAQNGSRLRIGLIADHKVPPTQVSGPVFAAPRPSARAVFTAPRAPIRYQAVATPRIGAMVPAPTPEVNVRANPRSQMRFPNLPLPEQPQGPRVQAAPRGQPTGRGTPQFGAILPAPSAPPGQLSPTIFSPNFGTGTVQVAQFSFVPAVVLTDGRVFANFNGGFEQVLRRCPTISGATPPGFTTSPCWVVDQFGRYLVAQPR